MTTFGRFRIEGDLGEGGMGRVLRAHDPVLQRTVAIKILRQAGADAQARLLREARAASALKHANICTVYEIGEVDGTPFIAMELVEGRPLSALIGSGAIGSGARTTDAAVRIAGQIAAALAHAHKHGIVHGDLKTQNVLVDESSGHVTLVDFGLASALDPASLESITSTQPAAAHAGTLPYMSPETLRGAPPRPSRDVWAFGIVLYELLAGRRPFDDDAAFALVAQILNDAPPPLPESMPPALAAIVTRSLAKNPAERYATASEVAAALDLARAAGEIGSAAGQATGADGSPAHRVSGPSRRAITITVIAGVVSLLVTLGMWLWQSGRLGGANVATASIKSIAVLPFDNLSRDPAEDYFADGMTDALITDLSRLPSLKVISRTSSSRYKTGQQTSQQISRDLAVEALVEGDVLRAKSEVRISVRLVQAIDDRILLSRSYTRPVEDVLALQAEVAQAIAGEIRASFAPADKARLESPASVRPAVLEAYLKGRHYWNRRSPDSLRQAVDHFKQALALDPDYAPALAGLAQVMVVLPAFPISAIAPAEALPQARNAALRAIEIDPRLAEAHAALGYERLESLDRTDAFARFQQAFAVNAGDATTHFWYAAALASAGRFDEALAEAQRAETLDPVSPIIVSGTAWMHHLARNFDREVAKAREALALDPSFLMAHYRLGEGLLAQGKATEAIASFDKARELSHGAPDLVAMAAFAYARANRRADAQKALKDLLAQRQAGTRYISSYAIALIYTGLNDHRQALDWLERAHTERAWGSAFLGVEVAFDPLRKEPRFQALITK